MVRVCVPVGLALALLLGGCSNAIQRMDLGEWQKFLASDPYAGEDAPRRAKASSSTPRAAVARDLIEQAEREEAARSEFWPWSRVDTKEREESQADEAAVPDRALKSASRTICRSC